jgi:hypothetical protein
MFLIPDLSSYTTCMTNLASAVADVQYRMDLIPPELSKIKTQGMQVIEEAALEGAVNALASKLIPPNSQKPHLIVIPEFQVIDLNTILGSVPAALVFSYWDTIIKNVCNTPIPTISGLWALLQVIKLAIVSAVNNLVNWAREQINIFISGLAYAIMTVDDLWHSYEYGVSMFLDDIEVAYFAIKKTADENTFYGKICRQLIVPLMDKMRDVWVAIKKLKKALEAAAILILETILDIVDAFKKWSEVIRCLMRVDTAKQILSL